MVSIFIIDENFDQSEKYDKHTAGEPHWNGVMDFDVGQRLKSLREAQNLSQRQLADLGGVTNGMISMVEQNRTSPSISSLKKILDGLGVSISEFFAAEAASEQKIFFRHDELTEITPNQQGDIRAVFRQVGPAADHTLQMLYERDGPSGPLRSETYDELDGVAPPKAAPQREGSEGDQPGEGRLWLGALPLALEHGRHASAEEVDTTVEVIDSFPQWLIIIRCNYDSINPCIKAEDFCVKGLIGFIDSISQNIITDD